MSEFSWRTRQQNLTQLAAQPFDVLIIGGGITGAGLALDAAARGLSVALVEKRDFAAGTSSRSTKLIHGGIRYLEQFDFSLVREALHERALLVDLAPQLAEPYPFLIPIYAQKKRNYDHPFKMRAGLFLYDLLAGRQNIARHRRLTRDEALQYAPQLHPDGLRGAFLYYDVRTDDVRLVLQVLKAAHVRGAVIANYARVVRFNNDEQGQVNGAVICDEQTGVEFAVQAHQVINATGVWMEETLALGAGSTSPAKQVRPSKGVHLTIAAERLPLKGAWLIPALTGHRFYFVVPWQGRVNIGTTDTDYGGDKDAPRAEADEITEILGAINAYFPTAQLESADVISTWAGLRPLISDPQVKNTTAVSRKEELFTSPDGIITLAGGKLTTYRLMAERGIDAAAQRLREQFGVQAQTDVTTEQIRLLALTDWTPQRMAREYQLPDDTAVHWLNSYGAEALAIAELARSDERLRARCLPDLPHLAAEFVYLARHEICLTLTDLLTRRTRLLMLAGGNALTVAPQIAAWIAPDMHWDGAQISAQLAACQAEYEREYALPVIEADQAKDKRQK